MLSLIVISILILFFICPLYSACKIHAVDPAINPIPVGEGELGSKSPAPAPAENVWRHSFGGPKLDSLMRKALDNNFNLRQTVTRLDQATWLRVSENHLGVVIEQALDAIYRAIGKRTDRLAHSATALPGRQSKRNHQGGVG
jgi:hypothetical protein